MLSVVGVFLLVLAVAAASGNTPLGKHLRVLLLEAPARVLNGMTPRRVAIGSVVILCLMAMVLFAPEWVAMIGLGDLSMYFDITIVALLLSAVSRSKSMAAYATRLGRVIASRFYMRFGGPTARSRHARLRKPKLPKASDEDGAGWQGAVAGI